MAGGDCTTWKASSNGAWAGDNPVHFALPLLTIQLCLILCFSRIFSILLRPLHQPRVIGEILGGIVLGASVLGNIPQYQEDLFPTASLTVLTTVANLGLLFFLFMVGLELDLRSLLRTGKSAVIISASGILVPFSLGVGVSFIIRRVLGIVDSKFLPFVVFMGVAMSITAFPVLARILAERKLLTTEVGQLAMSVAAVDDITAWVLLALAIALSSNSSGQIVAWILLCALAFLVTMFGAVRPLMARISRQVVENEPIPEWIVGITLTGVLVSAFATDVIGIHGIFGAFVFGLVIPKDGPFAGIIMEKIEDFTMTLLLPLYFASSGLNVRFRSMSGWRSIGLVVLVIGVACIGKIGGTIFAAVMTKIPFRKALVLGVLMNTKGLVELIVLNIGLQKKVITQELYTIMVIMALVTTFMTNPLVTWLYPSAEGGENKAREEAKKSDEDLRLLVCIHGAHSIPPALNLMEMSRGTRKHPLKAFMLHLVEFSERSSAIMMVTRVRKNGKPFISKDGKKKGPDQVAVAFQAYARLSKVSVESMTAISGFSNMHEDICSVAVDKRVNLIVLPYHKCAGPDGLEIGNPNLLSVTRRVQRAAPCSVAVLVDRSLGEAVQVPPEQLEQRVAALFYGGPDDREALGIAQRMAEHPGIAVTVIRFLPAAREEVVLSMPAAAQGEEQPEEGLASAPDDSEDCEAQLDEEALQTVKANARKLSKEESRPVKATHNAEEVGTQTLFYEERETEDAVAAAIDVLGESYNLIIVGRGRRPAPLLVRAMEARTPSVWQSEEAAGLGTVGAALAAQDAAPAGASLLVVQRHDSALVQTASLAPSGAATPRRQHPADEYAAPMP